jgi:periplasmic copper chaperone A
MRPVLFALALLASLGGAALAAGVTVSGATIPATAPGARTAAGYLSVANGGAEADRLVAVHAAFPRVELHTTEIDAAGVARMMAVDGVEVPARGTVELAPQGTHVMFMGLTAPLADGSRVPAVLVFEHAGEVAVEFSVVARDAAGGAMGGMKPMSH